MDILVEKIYYVEIILYFFKFLVHSKTIVYEYITYLLYYYAHREKKIADFTNLFLREICLPKNPRYIKEDQLNYIKFKKTVKF